MKKLICMILAVALLVPLAACGGGSGSSEPSEVGVYVLKDIQTYDGYDAEPDVYAGFGVKQINVVSPGYATCDYQPRNQSSTIALELYYDGGWIWSNIDSTKYSFSLDGKELVISNGYYFCFFRKK